MWRVLAVLLCISLFGLGAVAQTADSGSPDPFTNTSLLKPPAGAKVAIIEWEDMECPVCAKAFPIVHAAAKQYNVPLVRYDYLISYHAWSRLASTYARYLQDKVSSDLATEYRREVFASQTRISSPEDLKAFTQHFMSTHGQQMPFALDPKFEKEAVADYELGKKLNIQATPTIFVVTPNRWIQVKDVMDLYSTLDQAKATVGAATAASAHRTANRK